jgi:hypothetical protein
VKLRAGSHGIGLLLALGVAAWPCAGIAADREAVGDPVAADRSRALHDDRQGSEALVRVLRHHHALADGEGGFEWWLRLPFPVRARQAQVPEVRYWRNRLEFLRDAQRGDAAACAVSGGVLLGDPLLQGDDRAVETRRLEACRAPGAGTG